jgi:murein DD-endopeptidase MepM/ murein hydrolase activator NlpD
MGAHAPIYNQKYADDIAIEVGADIQAMRGGKVIAVRQEFADALKGPAGGNDNTVNYIVIEHDQDVRHASGNFYRSLYLHVMKNSVLVRVGDRVSAGQIIAKTGNNGTSTGPHLHVDVHYHLGGGIFNRMTVPYVWDNRRNG